MGSPAWSETRLRVRYAESDRMGFAYYGSYAAWLEVGRVEFLRERGLVYRNVEDSGRLLAVRRLELHYLAPARYDDVLLVRTRIAECGKCRIEFASEIRLDSGGHLLAEGRVVLACLDREGRPRRLGEDLAKACAV